MPRTAWQALSACALASLSCAPLAAQETSPPPAAPAEPAAGTDAIVYAPQVVPPGTPVRLMNLREVTSRTAVVGQKFKLRVNEPVYMNGKPVIPVGATAWGEVTSFDTNGAVGKGGKLGIRIVYVDLPEGRLPLTGDANQKGAGNGAGVAMAVVGFGLLGLFTAGDSARLKGGEQVTAYVGTAVGIPPPVAEPAAASVPAATAAAAAPGQTAPAEAPAPPK